MKAIGTQLLPSYLLDLQHRLNALKEFAQENLALKVTMVSAEFLTLQVPSSQYDYCKEHFGADNWLRSGTMLSKKLTGGILIELHSLREPEAVEVTL